MKILKTILEMFKEPKILLYYLDRLGMIRLSDIDYLKILYKKTLNKELNLEEPQTFNEKLQWLKLYDRNPEYTKIVDKYEVKKYVSELIGEEYIIPTIGIYDKFDDIKFDELPNQFVLKCTHDSASTIICKNKKEFNIDLAKKKIKKALIKNYYYFGREWPYKNVKPRIIVEKYMENEDGTGICDYKFYCFDGRVNYVMVCAERETGNPKFYYYDRNWALQKNMSKDGKSTSDNFYISKPKNLEEMFKISELLSKKFKFVRTDLYEINGQVYFGELTFYPSAGFDNTRTEECEQILAENLYIK